MKREKMTQHARNDRMERFYAILTTVGFGERIVAKAIEGTICFCLTETGVIILRQKDENGAIITAYCGHQPKVKAIFYRGTDIPRWLLGIIRKNERQHKELFEI